MFLLKQLGHTDHQCTAPEAIGQWPEPLVMFKSTMIRSEQPATEIIPSGDMLALDCVIVRCVQNIFGVSV